MPHPETEQSFCDRKAFVAKEAQRARGRALGALMRGKKRTTQAERDEIAAYLARNPEPFRGN